MVNTITKILVKILFFPFVLLQSCFSRFSGEVNAEISDSYYYAKGSGDIIYSPMGNWFELGYSKLDADKETFQPLSRNFGRDKNTVFYTSKKLEGADHSTFTVQDGIPKDKNHVYYETFYEVKIIEDADPESFFYLNDEKMHSREWGKDKSNHFYRNKKVNIDYHSFRILKNEYVVDKDFIYQKKTIDNDTIGWPETIFLKSDPRVGEIKEINSVYAIMNENVYANHVDNGYTKFKFEKINNIKVVNDDCLIINETIILRGKTLPFEGVDVKTLESMGDKELEYYKDKNNVYYLGSLIKDIDLKTFEVLNHGYAKDKNKVYFLEAIVEGANPATFHFDEKEFEWRDGKVSYQRGKPFNKKY